MNTEKANKTVSQLYFVEKGTWKNGQEVITVCFRNSEGKRQAVGHVIAHYDKEGNLTFASQDAKGNDIFPPCSNRYEMKKQFLDNEQELIQKFEKKPEQEKNPVEQNQQTVNQPAQVQQPVNSIPSEQKQPKEKTYRRRNELKDVRDAKTNNEPEQEITH